MDSLVILNVVLRRTSSTLLRICCINEFKDGRTMAELNVFSKFIGASGNIDSDSNLDKWLIPSTLNNSPSLVRATILYSISTSSFFRYLDNGSGNTADGLSSAILADRLSMLVCAASTRLDRVVSVFDSGDGFIICIYSRWG